MLSGFLTALKIHDARVTQNACFSMLANKRKCAGNGRNNHGLMVRKLIYWICVFFVEVRTFRFGSGLAAFFSGEPDSSASSSKVGDESEPESHIFMLSAWAFMKLVIACFKSEISFSILASRWSRSDCCGFAIV